MKKQRPINLNLWTIKMPMPAVASILHRISGFLLFFFIPGFLWVLQTSLQSAQGFASVSNYLAHPVLKFIVWVCISALIYHLLAGVRHLLMDIGAGDSLPGGRYTAGIVFFLSAVLIIVAGVWLW